DATVLVTGAASGLGAACCDRLLAETGMYILATDLRDEAIRRFPWCARAGDRVTVSRMDVTSAEEVEAVVRGIPADRPLRAVVHCAGILTAAKLVGRDGPHDLDLFRRSVEVNLVGTFNVMRWACAVMRDNPPVADEARGVFISTASVAAFEGQIGQVAYAAAKGGVAAMTLPAARELGRAGIRVVSVAPGVFETPMMGEAPPAVVESLVAQAVFPKRLGRPDEFASLVLEILRNPMLNGAVIRLDGAMRMAAR
ncbi:MAG TPA: SDR family NAD(P)-dependent oxidoreductase, partial [Bryobacterales bacterium]|nr:SDR family NAD(P)-dependent oxidoreductase [Bryobacterales bacterium]